jgi:hypothetical protein
VFTALANGAFSYLARRYFQQKRRSNRWASPAAQQDPTNQPRRRWWKLKTIKVRLAKTSSTGGGKSQVVKTGVVAVLVRGTEVGIPVMERARIRTKSHFQTFPKKGSRWTMRTSRMWRIRPSNLSLTTRLTTRSLSPNPSPRPALQDAGPRAVGVPKIALDRSPARYVVKNDAKKGVL